MSSSPLDSDRGVVPDEAPKDVGADAGSATVGCGQVYGLPTAGVMNLSISMYLTLFACPIGELKNAPRLQ